ncbi:MAG: hypothetical protein ABEJ28_00520 [Salinigranum sp.]
MSRRTRSDSPAGRSLAGAAERIGGWLTAAARRAESRAANPLVAAVLRSPHHPLLSGRLLLLSYEGRRSGRRYTTPVLYRRTDSGVDLFTPAAETTWWRNFRGGHPASALLCGTWRRGRGEVVADEASVFDHLRWVAAPVRRITFALLGRPLPTEERLAAAAGEFVIVRLTFEEE